MIYQHKYEQISNKRMHFDSDHSDQVSGAIYFAYPAIGDIKVHRSGKRKEGQWNGPWDRVTIRPPQW